MQDEYNGTPLLKPEQEGVMNVYINEAKTCADLI